MRAIRDSVVSEVSKVVIGQQDTIGLLLAALALGGHVLLEGVPGVAKTLLATTTARALGLDSRRIQFTPDLLPSDVTGTMTLQESEFEFREGPIFTNILVADEINRTPPKTQAALLEAMQEGQVTVAGEPHRLPEPFMVVATQNPIEYEGTYPLPEAQLDRFLFKIDVSHPTAPEEEDVLRLKHRGVSPATLDQVQVSFDTGDLETMRSTVDQTRVADEIVAYVTAIVRKTRELPSVELGASTRAAVHLLAAAKAAARLEDRDYVTPDDVATMAPPVLRHRLILRPDAELERYRPDDAVRTALAAVQVPR